MNEETKPPEGLELAETMCGHAFCADACTEDQMRAAVDAIRTEHAQRLTLQHHAANLAQRVADLEAERDELRARLTELERQEPVAWIANTPHSYCTTKLYARPVAAIPEGWKLVPVEATEAMHAAAVKTIVNCTGNADFPPRVWSSMIKAAPEHKA